MIGEAGGTASLAKGRVTLSIPSGALSAEVEFTATLVCPLPASQLIVPGSTREIGPSGTTFAKPVTLTLSYDPNLLPDGVREAELQLFQAAGFTWRPVLNATVDTGAHTVSGRVTGLGVFGAKGLPITRVEVSPSCYALEQGQAKGFTAVGTASSGMLLPERRVAWTSSDESVATVDTEGRVTAVGIGSATIRATAEGAGRSAEVNTWSCSWQTEIPATECQALIDLYDCGNEEDWRYTKNWVPTPYPCEWRGVTCGGGSVSRLFLRGLTGSIPNSLGDLSKLTGLDLYMNQLSGPIPLAVAQLGGRIQAKDGGGPKCVFIPPGIDGLSMPDTQEYREADLDGDGKICGVTIGGG